jgi:hypothetical protein
MPRPFDSYRAVRRNDAFARYRDSTFGHSVPWHEYMLWAIAQWSWVGPRGPWRRQ